ncbi:hypothetical protein PHYBLDRAFT_163162 [Phycomyces blakesleeanus NRRL 1555(-)]|uniref:Uncharacterized protein n=1 Tax=Phycomyces blakesleeanus (strain ATCC 8743b / DSM 1359 / FGSC 10004 / NBRC 33097 / NRRL 1555) TaxID=763407 RepID=A0A167QR59_PHYB8|nr:hypothetical protein PHYBLDRAFT_163162 [Phycomyces blakesleeanus NRRL 1555(-)]OAD80114.1 hypothetical protein PHYBLDRAFT_163162 [Phycomyces blakesleeanus NRRL 1555(-)]|eukprot:XP_018298154.1 hypothetical protein PHYBLDRAFT_163162 [Phycomyces blakesleeanus NRRL 1555(-)]
MLDLKSRLTDFNILRMHKYHDVLKRLLYKCCIYYKFPIIPPYNVRHVNIFFSLLLLFLQPQSKTFRSLSPPKQELIGKQKYYFEMLYSNWKYSIPSWKRRDPRKLTTVTFLQATILKANWIIFYFMELQHVSSYYNLIE